jgi:hypothetical protein
MPLARWHAGQRVGDVSGFAPGDIQRVRDFGERTAGSIYVYGTDILGSASSVRRYDDVRIVPADEDG